MFYVNSDGHPKIFAVHVRTCHVRSRRGYRVLGTGATRLMCTVQSVHVYAYSG